MSSALAISKQSSGDLNSRENLLKSFRNTMSTVPLVGGRRSVVDILVCRNWTEKAMLVVHLALVIYKYLCTCIFN